MPYIYASDDDGELYPERVLDADQKVSDRFTKYEVAESVTLTADQLCGGYGRIVEILLRAGKIKRSQA